MSDELQKRPISWVEFRVGNERTPIEQWRTLSQFVEVVGNALGSIASGYHGGTLDANGIESLVDGFVRVMLDFDIKVTDVVSKYDEVKAEEEPEEEDEDTEDGDGWEENETDGEGES